jgi:hypothetical protein
VFLHSAQAVDKPKAPLPTIRMDEGISEEDDAIAKNENEQQTGNDSSQTEKTTKKNPTDLPMWKMLTPGGPMSFNGRASAGHGSKPRGMHGGEL